ncbi:MAG: hypothetical protein AB1726_11360 [Planctomycetota bacterium]
MRWRIPGRISPAHLVGWPLVLLLLLVPGPGRAPVPPARGESPLRRLLAPAAELAAAIQWVRYQNARLAGRAELAIARAEGALALDPRNPAGWEILSAYLAFDLASAEREADPAARRRWFEAGLEVARRGAELASDPRRLALWRGGLFAAKALTDPALPWPGGTPALWREAAEAFGAAGEAEAARAARERASE